MSRHTILTIARFVVSGGSATLANLLAVYIFTEWFGLWYLVSAVIAFCIGIIISFLAQKVWTFEDRSWEEAHIQAGVFVLFTLWGLILNTVVVYGLVEYMSVHYIVAQLAAGVLIAFQNFFVYRLIFKPRS